MAISVSSVDVITPPITALPNGARKSAPSPAPIATGIMPAISAKVVMRIGRRRIAPPSIRASRSDSPSRSRDHLAKSMSRIAFLATMPMSRITPIRLMMFSVSPVASSISTTPISDSGSDIRIASGSMNDPNCITRIRYISSTAVPSAANTWPKTSAWSLASPPWRSSYPSGSSLRIGARATSMSARTSDSDRSCVFACTVTTLVRSRWSICAGPMFCRTVAIWPNGSVIGPLGPAIVMGSCSRSAVRLRASGDNRTRTSRVSPCGSTQSPASIPANAGRSACATWPTVIPNDPATPRLSCTSSSGFWPLVDRPTSTAPGTERTAVAIRSANCARVRESSPRSSSWICLKFPAQTLLNTVNVAPPTAVRSRRSSDVKSLWCRSRSAFFTIFT